MIRSIAIPRTVGRMGALPGSVGIGAGGSAGMYSFDATGLSDDPQLASYLQDLTPAQLQDALNGVAPSPTDMGTTDIATLASCATSYDPTICGPPASNPLSSLLPSLNVPTWAWIAGAGVLGLVILKR